MKFILIFGGSWVRQRCRVSRVQGASSWYWLTVGQGLLSLQQVRVEGECFYFFCFLTFIHFPLSPLSLSFISLTISSLFSLSLGDDTKWPKRVDMSLNPNTIIPIFQWNMMCNAFEGPLCNLQTMQSDLVLCCLCTESVDTVVHHNLFVILLLGSIA